MRLVGTLVYRKSENLRACEPGVGQKSPKILGNYRINRQYTYIKRRVSIAPRRTYVHAAPCEEVAAVEVHPVRYTMQDYYHRERKRRHL
jgi:hypothetical protein